MVNVVLERARGAGYPKVGDQVLEESEAYDKGRLLFVSGYDPEAVKGRRNIELGKVFSIGEGVKGFAD